MITRNLGSYDQISHRCQERSLPKVRIEFNYNALLAQYVMCWSTVQKLALCADAEELEELDLDAYPVRTRSPLRESSNYDDVTHHRAPSSRLFVGVFPLTTFRAVPGYLMLV